jgi:hypothetical protein
MATKYFLKFKTEAEYKEAKKKHLKVPNVSFVVETGKTYINTESVTKENAEAGDIIAHNGNEVKYFKPEAFDKTNSPWVADAIVVVPSRHTNDGTVRAMVLNNTKLNVSWGTNQPIDTVEHYQGVITIKDYEFKIKPNGYLPLDIVTKIQNQNDEETYYGTLKPLIPSPYNNDGSKNKQYHCKGNVLSDMQGAENTEKIIEKANNDIKLFPAIDCCKDAYLPSCGELGYLIVRIDRIKYAIEQTGHKLETNQGVWSSSQFGNNGAWAVFPSTGSVFGADYNKNVKTPFCASMWNIQNEITLGDYIILYSGATVTISTADKKKKEIKLIKYGELDKALDEFKDTEY